MIQIPEFVDKKEQFAYLITNKRALIDLKKSVTKFTDGFGMSALEQAVIKDLTHTNEDTDTAIKRTIVGNTYNWMDSHDDVHINGLFSKSLTERQPWHLHDHVYQLMAKVGTPTSVREEYINWTRLGVNKLGQTQALLMDSTIEKELNASIFRSYLNGEINQHSVGMKYVKISLAVNDEEYKEEFAAWNSHIEKIGNRQDAEAKGYFWAVTEAKLIEISCVLEGSNSLTPVLGIKHTEGEPVHTTPQQPSFDLSSAIKQTKFIN